MNRVYSHEEVVEILGIYHEMINLIEHFPADEFYDMSALEKMTCLLNWVKGTEESLDKSGKYPELFGDYNNTRNKILDELRSSPLFDQMFERIGDAYDIKLNRHTLQETTEDKDIPF